MNVTVIDGRSGSGKTSLATRLAADSGAQLLHLEDLYPGWQGLAAGSLAVPRVLEQGRYRRYDWHAGGFGEWATIDPTRPLIIEGCGALTRANLAAARRWLATADLPAAGTGGVHSIWLECPEAVRRQRALARDGEAFAPHWQQWAAQEEAQLSHHQPWQLADEVRIEP